MNYFLRKIGYKEDRVSVGLNRLSIALIILNVIYSPIFFQRKSIFLHILLNSILIYFFFILLALLISGCRYGFCQHSRFVYSQTVKRKVNLLYFFSLKQMGIKTDTVFHVIQGIGVSCALFIVISFLLIFFAMCGTCFMDHPWAHEEDIVDIGIGISSGKELLESVGISIIIGFLIYIPFLLLAWIWSGFRYGSVKGEKKVVPLLYINDLSYCMNNIKKDLGGLNWYVCSCDQQKIILKGNYQLSDDYQIEVVAEDISYFRGCNHWFCEISEKQFMHPNIHLDAQLNIIKSLAFYNKDDDEVFLVAADKILFKFNTINEYNSAISSNNIYYEDWI